MDPTTTYTKKNLESSNYWKNKIRDVEQDQKRKIMFLPPKLPYSFSALNMIYNESQLKYHFLNFHMKAFEEFLDLINNTKLEKMGMIQLFDHSNELDERVIENAGAVFNHQLFWDNLSPYGGEISEQLELAINYSFGSVYKLKLDLIEKGKSHKCCGWLWLIVNENNELQLITTKLNINPLMKDAPITGIPILAVDLWEHAYCHKFNYEKEDYLKNVWILINWTELSSRFRFVT